MVVDEAIYRGSQVTTYARSKTRVIRAVKTPSRYAASSGTFVSVRLQIDLLCYLRSAEHRINPIRGGLLARLKHSRAD